MAKQKKPGNGAATFGDNGVYLTEDTCTNVAILLLEMYPKLEYSDPDLMARQDKLYEGINSLVNKGLKIGNQILYAAAGLSKDNVYDWENGSRTREHSDFVKRIKLICTSARELYMASGQINPVTGIFWQKNYDGLSDVQQINVLPTQPLGEKLPEVDIKRLLGD